MKVKLVTLKMEDPILTAYEVVNVENGIVLGLVSQYWHETARLTLLGTTFRKTKRWVGVALQPLKVKKYVSSRKAAVAFVLEQGS